METHCCLICDYANVTGLVTMLMSSVARPWLCWPCGVRMSLNILMSMVSIIMNFVQNTTIMVNKTRQSYTNTSKFTWFSQYAVCPHVKSITEKFIIKDRVQKCEEAISIVYSWWSGWVSQPVKVHKLFKRSWRHLIMDCMLKQLRFFFQPRGIDLGASKTRARNYPYSIISSTLNISKLVFIIMICFVLLCFSIWKMSYD